MAGWLNRMIDRFIASDPGLSRLRMATSAALSMVSALAIEYGWARLEHANAEGTVVAMLLGAVMAMMGAMPLAGSARWPKVWTAVWFPVAAGVGMVGGVAVHGRTDWMLCLFVVVMFIAVAVRRFGMAYFFYGFMTWMGYFFAAFLDATPSQLPGLMEAVVLATAWTLLLSITVLRTHPRLALKRTLAACDARARAVLQALYEVLKADSEVERERAGHVLRTRQMQLAEAALIVEGWSAEPGALPPDLPPLLLRRRLIDLQHTLDQLAEAAVRLMAHDGNASLLAAHVAKELARRDPVDARAALAALGSAASGTMAVRQFIEGASEFLEEAAPALVPNSSAFEPVVGLALENLSGSPAIAKDVPALGTRWNPLARLDLTTRQAIQVAVSGGLAIIAGRALSPMRYYWAVIAAFVMFAGTASRTEAIQKGINRVLGTLFGLVAGVAMAEVTAGHVAWVLATIVVSMFLGFYLVRVSYVYMIFFITIMVGQLYSVLHEFSPGLLVLRLEETAIGSAAGLVVALAVVPLSTRDTVRTARNRLLAALADLLEAAANSVPDLDAWSRALDNRLRELVLVASPLSRPLLGGNLPKARHRIALYTTLITHARALTVALRTPPRETEQWMEACRALAKAARCLGEPQGDADSALAESTQVLFQSGPLSTTDPVLRPLVHVERLLKDLRDPW